MEDGKSLGQT